MADIVPPGNQNQFSGLRYYLVVDSESLQLRVKTFKVYDIENVTQRAGSDNDVEDLKF